MSGEKAKRIGILKITDKKIDLTEIYKIIVPIDQNPSSCATYEKVLLSSKVRNLVEKNGFRWAIALVERAGSAHTSHDNFNLHNK